MTAPASSFQRTHPLLWRQRLARRRGYYGGVAVNVPLQPAPDVQLPVRFTVAPFEPLPERSQVAVPLP